MKIVSTLIEAHLFRYKNNEIEFLLMRRAETETYPNLWQMVTGSMHENEKAFQTALREVKEETSFDVQKMWVVPQVNSFYSHERDEICFVPVFACSIDAAEQVVLSQEHSEYKWMNKEEAKKHLAWKGQRNAVDTIYEYLTNQDCYLKFVEIDLKQI